MNAPAEIPSLNLNVYQRLNMARNAFHGLSLKKTGHNKFAGYFYFELGDFLIPALKVFSEHGLTAIVSFGAETAHMAIINSDDPKDSFQITSPMGSAALKGCHEVQNIGAVETYQRRYLWVAALEIVEHDALDSSEPIKPVTKAVEPPKPIPESSKSIAKSDFDKLPAARQKALTDLSIEINDAFIPAAPEAAYDVYRQIMDNLDLIEEQAALKSLLASNVRTAFGKVFTARKSQLTPAGELATQA